MAKHPKEDKNKKTSSAEIDYEQVALTNDSDKTADVVEIDSVTIVEEAITPTGPVEDNNDRQAPLTDSADEDVDAAVDILIEELTTDIPDTPKDTIKLEDNQTTVLDDDSPEEVKVPTDAIETKDEQVTIADAPEDSKDTEKSEAVEAENEQTTIVEATEDSKDANTIETVEIDSEQVTVTDDNSSESSTETTDVIDNERVTVVDATEDSSNSPIEGCAEATAERKGASPVTTGASDPARDEAIVESSTASKKKSKAPIILLICFLLCAIGGLITWLILRSTPEAQVTDAISGLLTSNHLSTTGTVNIKFDQSANPDISSVRIDLGTNSDHNIPVTNSATLSITTQSNANFKLDLGETITRDGTIYLKISGLQKAINSAKVPDEVQNYLDYFADIIKETDNQWWMISVPDLIDQLSTTLDTTIDSGYADAYQCILNEIADNDGSELANLYKQHPFITVANYTGSQLQPVDGGTIFSISINQPELTNFQDALSSSDYQNSLKKCLDKIPGFSDSSSSTSAQATDTLDTLAELTPAYIEVAGFDHHLARIYYSHEIDDFGSVEVDLRFSFPTNISIDTPTNARAITELIEDVIDDYTYMVYDIYGDYYVVETTTTTSNCASCTKNAYTN